MATNTTATVSTDIVFQQQDTFSNSFDNRQGSLGYSIGLTSGTGAPAASGGASTIDSVYSLADYVLSSGQTLKIDFTSLSQTVWGSSFSINMTGIKSLGVYNQSTGLGYEVLLRASGSNALTEPFNGGSGNIYVKPDSTYIYSDPYFGIKVDSSNKFLYIFNEGGVPVSGPANTGVKISVIAVGVTGS